MDPLMKRSRAFAEAVVMMVCPVVLAIVLKKVDLKSEEHGSSLPIFMLVVAAFTLILGTLPLLFLCFSKIFFNYAWRFPSKVTSWLAPISCVCLVGLASWIIHLIFSEGWRKYVLPIFGAVLGVSCIVTYSVTYLREQNDPANLAPGNLLPVNAIAAQNAMEAKLDESLEFLTGATVLLFLGLEVLALEGQTNCSQHRLAAPMGICFLACLFGVCFMLFETIPFQLPRINDRGLRAIMKRNFPEICDASMAVAIAVTMLTIMCKLMGVLGLSVLCPLLLLLLEHAFPLLAGGEGEGRASLEVTKVTFTGFLAVSIPAISRDSLYNYTKLFLVFAGAAIFAGFSWRLLTNAKKWRIANIASFCTYFCVAIATVPFTVMAGKAL